MTHGCGWLPDPLKTPGETPDYDAEEKLGSVQVPLFASALHLVPTILDQGASNSCVANAGATAIRASQIRQGQKSFPLPSRLFGYYFSRAYHGSTTVDGGTYIRLFFEACNRFGFPAETHWPFDLAKINKPPAKNAVRMAYDQSAPTEYRRIFTTGDARIRDIKRAIASEHLVVFGTDVSENFGRGKIDPKIALPPPVREPIIGGHAMCVAGYQGDDFTIVNSWGKNWGDDGKCLFSADYLAWGNTRDIWIVEHSPIFSELKDA